MLNKSYLPSITEHFPGLVVMYNIRNGKYIYVNKSVKKILGYSPEDFIEGGFEFVSSIVHPEDLPRILKENSKALEKADKSKFKKIDQSPIATFEYRMRHKNGKWIWFYTEGSVFKRDKEDKTELVLNVSLDITELKEKEHKLLSLNEEINNLKENARGFRSFIEVVRDYAIFRLDEEGRIITWNDGIKHIFGYEEREILGKSFSIFFTPEDLRHGKPQKALEIARQEGTSIEEGLRVRKDGTTFFASTTTTAIVENGEVKGYSQILRDVTEKREAEETIRFHAYHDILTGLMNRKALDEHFDITKSIVGEQKIALLFLDLDRFKTINDTLGHGIGDLILKEVALRIQESVSSKDVVARLGGDEFVVLLPDISTLDDVVKTVEKILKSFELAIQIPNRSLHLSTSIGVAIYPEDGEDIFNLLKNADTALYRAKDAGRNRFQFYDVSMNLHSFAKLALENDLRRAITNDEIIFHYQPIVNKNRKLIGVEALTRWNHPTLGLLQPGEFISLAEETGLIKLLGNEGNKKVWEQCKIWKIENNFCCRVSVNISSKHFDEIDFIKEFQKSLSLFNLSPYDVELEITESIAMNNNERTTTKLNDLKNMGVSLSIDDFGTGYSSLSYLKNFPISRLKIDKSFIRNCIENSQDQSIIKAIIAVGHSLGFEVIAEGVETEDQFELLKEEKCDGFQGYLFGKPLRPENFVKWLDPKNNI